MNNLVRDSSELGAGNCLGAEELFEYLDHTMEARVCRPHAGEVAIENARMALEAKMDTGVGERLKETFHNFPHFIQAGYCG